MLKSWVLVPFKWYFFSPSLQPWQPPFYSLFLCVWLIQIRHISSTISVCPSVSGLFHLMNIMSSSFIHVFTNNSIAFFFKAEWFSIMYVAHFPYPSIHWWTLGCFHVLATVNNIYIIFASSCEFVTVRTWKCFIG